VIKAACPALPCPALPIVEWGARDKPGRRGFMHAGAMALLLSPSMSMPEPLQLRHSWRSLYLAIFANCSSHHSANHCACR
jgi:hypothetical protein